MNVFGIATLVQLALTYFFMFAGEEKKSLVSLGLSCVFLVCSLLKAILDELRK